MYITFSNYSKDPGFTPEYHTVLHFLKTLGCNDTNPLNISWVRWEWCRSNDWFDSTHVNLTGIWKDNGEIVGVVCYETQPGDGFISLKEGYDFLLEEMFDYAVNHLKSEGKVKIAIPDKSRALQLIAQKRGFIATNDRETDSVLDTAMTPLDYTLPEGFGITSLQDRYDMEQYASVLWYGFDHGKEGPPPISEKDLATKEKGLKGPHNDLHLKIAITNPQGDFVSYAGLWYDRKQDFCTLEPCATHPEYRRRGLGKAAIYEGIQRCKELGAKRCVVGSNQDFYFRIGFAPYDMRTYWVQK